MKEVGKVDEGKLSNRRLMVSYSRIVNLGNYESERIQADLSADIPDDENLDKVYEDMFTIVRNQVSEECGEGIPDDDISDDD